MIKRIFKYFLAIALVIMSLSGILIASKQITLVSAKSTKPMSKKTSSSTLPYDSIGNASKSIGSAEETPSPSDKFTVDLGATKSRENAEKILESLAQKGIQGFYTPVQRENGSLAFRVRVGLYRTEEEAAQNVKKITSVTPFTANVLKI
ncbi:MAG: SPOR domain-containing protein [Pseudomonadota bacterium]